MRKSTHAPQSPVREIVLGRVVGARFEQKDLRSPYEITVDGQRLALQGDDLHKLSLICDLFHKELLDLRAAEYKRCLEAGAARDLAQVKDVDFTKQAPAVAS